MLRAVDPVATAELEVAQPGEGSWAGIVDVVVVAIDAAVVEELGLAVDDDDELQLATRAVRARRHTPNGARRGDIVVQSVSRCQLLRQPRSNGRRHASGAMSW